jgi:hypothetical protein
MSTPTNSRTAGRHFTVSCSTNGQTETLLQLVKEKNVREGQSSVIRADLRMGVGPKGQLFVMNKCDGTIRLLVP